ncbi:MAG: tetratricopeptide repeat protein [bacterium]|nr:tetratricopeptide repeat protein [bacterium]
MKFQRIQTFSGMGLAFLLAILLGGCPQVQETPGHRPDTLPETEQQQPEDAMERLTAEWAYKQGLTFFDRGNADEAIRHFQLAVERDAMHLRAYLSLGDMYSMQQKYLLAESYYTKVLRYDPESVSAYTALGTMYRKMGNYRESLSFYRKILELDPSNQFAGEQIVHVTNELFDWHYKQGMAYKETGDVEQALVELQKAQSFYPDNIEFTVEIGDLFLQQNDYVMADSYFQQTLSQQPDYFPAIIGAGKVQLALRHYAEALNYFQAAQELQPNNPGVRSLIQQAQSDKVSSSLPPQYREIGSKEQVGRGDIAALLMVELMLGSRLPASTRVVIISDITTHWAKPYVIQAVQLNLMALPPDRYFRPHEAIRKGELAFILDTISRQLSVPLPQGSSVIFADVYPENQYHNAILRVYSAGIINAESEDRFGIGSPVSGGETLQIFQQFKALL